ncbi:hypothetical protein QYM36_019272 [Artemia franciscana]|uniref:Uncharacterized protein n=1 Tax=Artemia franciscana TaxID=6661 RepID=A0AA88HB20_ARTSF|nr:hypothetical protein QYM36_019272 [Artemia franciscana]
MKGPLKESLEKQIKLTATETLSLKEDCLKSTTEQLDVIKHDVFTAVKLDFENFAKRALPEQVRGLRSLKTISSFKSSLSRGPCRLIL